ncbi:hypothetical protein ABGB16_14185 [Micromonospora sp. B11E3]|uniref:hypothetical protein n=1 Tax=Micromonospora sp. B11E3 TaxID=3153562 RepID=UPI00325D210C
MSQASEFLRDREHAWAPALSAVSLAAELGVPEDEARQAIRALGRVCAGTSSYDRRWLLTNRYPACLVVGLAGVGAIGYEHGNYWSAVHELALGRVDQTLWGEVFRANLDRFKLARFPGLPQINVGEILMHAGVPAYCISDLLNLLLHRLVRDPGMSAEHFLAWALTPGRESRLLQLDKPVQRFLQYGGDYAEDLLDRCLDLLDRLRQPAFHADGLGLPAHLITKAQRLAEAGQLDWTATADRTHSGHRTTHFRPYLELEPFGRGLLVRLPAVPDAADGHVVWHVRVDDAAQTVVSRSMWPGVRETAPATALTIARPARHLVVELATYDQEYEIELVDQRDPLLVFTDDGRRLPATSSLPPEPVWLLYPQENDARAPLELHVTGELGDLGDVPAPYGWLGWTLRRVDLTHTSELRLGDGAPRRVKGARRAQLRLDPPLAGVFNPAGAPVVAAAPALTLPTELGVATEWSIRIRRGSEQLFSEAVTVTRDTTVDPWQRLPRPLVGTYEVTVRGPLGRGLSRTLELAEGLNARSNPSWREMRADGLEPAAVRATPTLHHLTVTPTEARLGSKDLAAEVRLDSPAGAATVRVTPAHMAVQRLSGGTRADWSLQPLRLDTETIGEGELLVRLPHVTDAQLVVKAAGRELQTVATGATYGQPLARFSLAAIADTVGVHGIAQLDVRVNGQDIPVARCTPRRLASSVLVEDDRLHLVGGVYADGLVAGLYQVYAPWRPPHVVSLHRDLISDSLPSEVTAAGPLVALLRVEDPWVPAEWPDWPGAENAFDIADREWKPSAHDGAEDAVSGYLAGLDDLPDRPDIAPLLIDLYHRADDLRGRVTRDVRGACTGLRQHPGPTLTALTRTTTSADRLVAPLVHSGLIAAPPREYVGERDELRLWGISALAGMLASAHRLGVRDEQLREQISAVCGDVALRILDGGDDPHRIVGRFDESALRLAALPVEIRDQMWRAMRIVPGGLLDADERVTAARHLFEVRIRPGLGRVSSAARDLLLDSRQQLHAGGGTRVTEAVRARNPTSGWQALPAVSLALAFVARLAARGHDGCARLLPRTLPAHATLARSAPRLVTIDLLLAEFILIGSGVAR